MSACRLFSWSRLIHRRIAPILALSLVAWLGVTEQALALTATTTTVASAPNPSSLLGMVTFTVTVSGGGGTPTGPVAINFGDGNFATPSLDLTGKATATHNYLAAGNYTAVATYVGDVNFATSSGTTQQTVSKANPLVAVSGTNPGTAGALTNFTATVTGILGINPTGSVTFDFGDGATLSTPLGGGSASAPHIYTTSGPFTVTATYSGDSNYNTGSGTLAETINKQNSVTAVSGPGGSTTLGLPATIQV